MSDEGTGWVCKVCGYVHRGPAPPETCPVCGADASEFEERSEAFLSAGASPIGRSGPARSRAPVPDRRWRCLVCLYEHEGPEPPKECPVCGASSDDFEPVEDEPAAESGEGGERDIVILGAGVAGVSAAEAARKALPSARITLVGAEEDLPYYRINLSRYLAGEVPAEALPLHPENWYEDNRIRLLRGAEAHEVSLEDKTVFLKKGDPLKFDKLVLALGAHPFIPPILGASLRNVGALRTVRQADRLLELVKSGRPCVCIGGGILGLETAGALARRGAKVTVLEGFEWLMPRQLNRRAGELLKAKIEAMGIEVRLGALTAKLTGEDAVDGVELKDGSKIPAGFVVITTGIRSNTHLARRAGLEVNNGVVVDSHLTSSHPDVLAAGDLAEFSGQVYGLWNASQYMGSIAGLNAAGVPTAFGGLPRSNVLKVLGIDLLSVGEFEPKDGSYRVIEDEEEEDYRRFVFRDGALSGAVILGKAGCGSAVKTAVEKRRDFSEVLRSSPTARSVLDRLAAS